MLYGHCCCLARDKHAEQARKMASQTRRRPIPATLATARRLALLDEECTNSTFCPAQGLHRAGGSTTRSAPPSATLPPRWRHRRLLLQLLAGMQAAGMCPGAAAYARFLRELARASRTLEAETPSSRCATAEAALSPTSCASRPPTTDFFRATRRATSPGANSTRPVGAPSTGARWPAATRPA